MRAINWRRWWPLTGIAFVALYIIGIAVISTPDSKDTDTEILAHYAKHSNRVNDFIAFFLILAAVLMLIWFVSLLRNRLMQAAGRDGVLPSLCFGAGLVAAALWGVTATLFAGPSAAISDTSKFHLDPNT
jgi:hypothetical protein